MAGRLLYIRADGNGTIGMGHLMRCFVIAEEWIRQGNICRFIVSDSVSADIVKSSGYEAADLSSIYGRQFLYSEFDGQTECTCDYLLNNPAEIMLIDTYFYTPSYVNAAGRFVKTALLGVTVKPEAYFDMIINYTVYADIKDYGCMLSEEKNTKLLLGTKYFPLRNEFKSAITCETAKKADKENKVQDIFIATGGTDLCHAALKLVQRLKYSDYRLHIVVGKYNTDYEELKKEAAQSDKINIYYNAGNMAQIMSKCDIAVSAGGITLYELAAMRIPTITFSFVDNQLAGTEAFDRKGCMLYAGDIRQVSDIAGVIEQNIELLAKDCSKRSMLSKNAGELVDGMGAERIVKALIWCLEM